MKEPRTGITMAGDWMLEEVQKLPDLAIQVEQMFLKEYDPAQVNQKRLEVRGLLCDMTDVAQKVQDNLDQLNKMLAEYQKELHDLSHELPIKPRSISLTGLQRHVRPEDFDKRELER